MLERFLYNSKMYNYNPPIDLGMRPDLYDEYLRMSERTTQKCLYKFVTPTVGGGNTGLCAVHRASQLPNIH